MTPQLTIPEGLDVLPGINNAVIRRRWFSWTVIPLTFFVIIWDGFLFFFYSMIFSSPKVPIFVALFPSLHLSVGLGLTYYCIATYLNKTDIVLSPSSVKVATGPVPWAGNKEVPMETITEAVVRERRGNKGAVSYSVLYVDGSRKEQSLVKGLGQRDQAEFIAKSVNALIGSASPETSQSR